MSKFVHIDAYFFIDHLQTYLRDMHKRGDLSESNYKEICHVVGNLKSRYFGNEIDDIEV